MSRSFEIPRIGPDDSMERVIGARYRMDMHYFQRQLPQLQRLPDISILTGKGVLEPHRDCEGLAFVPKDYFPEHMLEVVKPYYLQDLVPDNNPDKLTAVYLKYLLERKLFSIKSKLAQSAWEILANFGVDPYLSFEVQITKRGFYFPMLIRNLNPKVSFLTPSEPFPAFRFFLPSKPLVGASLVQQVSLMQNSGLLVENEIEAQRYQLQELAALKPTDQLLFEGSRDPVNSVIVPIVREGEFVEEKTVAVQDLIDCPSTNRQALDKIWGLNWRTVGEKPVNYYMQEVAISESGPLVMPDGIAGVIDQYENRLDTQRYGRSANHGVLRHISSPLIDPKFGFSNGQPIRFEHYKIAVFDEGPLNVRMFLHHSD